MSSKIEASHQWTVDVYRSPIRRYDVCKQCGLRVCNIVMGDGAWHRSAEAGEIACSPTATDEQARYHADCLNIRRSMNGENAAN